VRAEAREAGYTPEESALVSPAQEQTAVKRTNRIVLSLVPVLSAAALAAGCGSRGQQASGQGWQTCVDSSSRVADEQACTDEQRASHPAGYVPSYRWYYYPYGGHPYPLGYGVPLGGTYGTNPFTGVRSASSGGAAAAVAGAAASGGAHAGSTSFGGFGSTAAHAGGGASAGE
jgi:hypothetical protein